MVYARYIIVITLCYTRFAVVKLNDVKMIRADAITRVGEIKRINRPKVIAVVNGAMPLLLLRGASATMRRSALLHIIGVGPSGRVVGPTRSVGRARVLRAGGQTQPTPFPN